MDILSDTLRVVRLTGAIFFKADLCGTWAFLSPPAEEIRDHLRSSSECLILFHIVEKGDCWVRVNDKVTFHPREGDAIIFPHGNSHIMSSLPSPPASSVYPVPIDTILGQRNGEVFSFAFGTRGDNTRVVCGYLQCDQKFNPLISSLPMVLWLRHGQHDDVSVVAGEDDLSTCCIVPFEKGQWLETTLHYALHEVRKGSDGNGAMLARLSEIMFVDVLRRYVELLSPDQEGWLAAVHDKTIGHVLRLMHAEPERAWTVDELASRTAVSRSSLAQRFASLVGETPMQYLTGWRIQVAKHLLRQTNLTIGEIASRAGYTSEVSFTHAFKRHVGQPPVAWRREEETAEYEPSPPIPLSQFGRGGVRGRG